MMTGIYTYMVKYVIKIGIINNNNLMRDKLSVLTQLANSLHVG